MTFNKFKTCSIICVFALVTLLLGCKKSTYYQLSDEDMTWLAYKNNQIITFSNGVGDEIQYYTTLRTKSYTKDGDTYSEFTTADVLQLNDTSAFTLSDSQGGLYISTGAEGFSVLFSWPHFVLKNIPITNKIATAQNIGGINYADVIELDANGLTDLRFYISHIWLSKTLGVLQVEDTLGNIWVREF
jgi:hypothetical protein